MSTPRGHNDDWYWLYAALASGSGCKVVSNDEMRDHHFGMLAPRSFLRWKERHIVKFKFRGTQLEPEFEEPLPYSNVIQEDPETGSWHFPSIESGKWLCVQRVTEGDE